MSFPIEFEKTIKISVGGLIFLATLVFACAMLYGKLTAMEIKIDTNSSMVRSQIERHEVEIREHRERIVDLEKAVGI